MKLLNEDEPTPLNCYRFILTQEEFARYKDKIPGFLYQKRTKGNIDLYPWVFFIPEYLYKIVAMSDVEQMLKRLDEICNDSDLLAFYEMKYEFESTI